MDKASDINPSVSNSIKKRGSFSCDARNNLAGKKMLTPPPKTIPDCQKEPFGTLGARLAAAVAVVVGTRRNEGERPREQRAQGREGGRPFRRPGYWMEGDPRRWWLQGRPLGFVIALEHPSISARPK